MVSLGIDGLISGLDTTSLIAALMTQEAGPQTLLKTKQTETSTLVTALQALNTKVASLATNATTAATAASWNAYTASSSATSVTVSAGASALPSSLSFSVDAVASNQVSLSDAFTNASELFPTNPPVLTVKRADGTLTTINPASNSLDDITTAINAASDSGIKAVAVKIGSEFRLQLTATATGASNGFDVYLGSSADVTAGTATALSLTSTKTAADAKITLWPGSAAAKQVTSASNTFSDTLTGVGITVSAMSTDPITVTVARDKAAATKLASDMVAGLGLVLGEIASQTASKTTTAADGGTVITGGVLSSESQVRDLAQSLQSAASYPVDGKSPSSVGITIDKAGNFAFDETVFAAAMDADPIGTQKMVATLSQRVADVAKGASDATTGSLTLKITSQQGEVKDLGDRILEWDKTLALRKEGIQATYTALEVSLSALKSQSSWLTSQLAALSSGTSSTG